MIKLRNYKPRTRFLECQYHFGTKKAHTVDGCKSVEVRWERVVDKLEYLDSKKMVTEVTVRLL